MGYTLSSEHIDAVSGLMEAFMSKAKTDQKSMLRIRLAAESVLLKYQELFGPENELSLKLVNRSFNVRIELSIPGERRNPFETEDELDSEVLRSILSGMGVIPSWQYQDGVNLILFTPKRKKRSPVLNLTASAILACILGGVCLRLPESLRVLIQEGLVTPVFDTLMGLLNAVAGPLVFLSVAWGIYSIGDTVTLGRIGKRVVSRFLLMTLLLSIAACAMFLPFFPMEEYGGGSIRFSEVLGMVLDIIPGNLITPFIEGNPMQIIFIAILLGVAMLVLHGKMSTVGAFVEQFNLIIQLIMTGITAFMPLFVFCSIFTIILSGSLFRILDVYKMFPLLIAGDLLIMAVYVSMVCVRKQLKSGVLIKKLLPTFLIGLTTASSAAAFSVNVDCCENRLGIDRKIVNFGVPLGQTTFMPGASLLFILSALCMAELYGIAISLTWLIMAVVTSVILAVAAPSIPGGAVSCFTALFVQLGLPMEAVALMVTLNVVFDFITTATNLFCLQAELVELSGSVDMLDVETLRRNL